METKLTKANADGAGAFPPDGVLVGDVFLVGVEVVHRDGGCWIEWHVIKATESGWDDTEGDTWGSWDVSDVTFWAKLPNRIES